MGFIYTSTGTYVSLSHVVSAEPKGSGKVVLRLADGEAVAVATEDWHEAMKMQGHAVIPAREGCLRLEAFSETDGQRVIHQEPVQGWLVLRSGVVLPVTAQGWDAEFPDVLMPDGRVVRHEVWYDTLEEWKQGPGGFGSADR